VRGVKIDTNNGVRCRNGQKWAPDHITRRGSGPDLDPYCYWVHTPLAYTRVEDSGDENIGKENRENLGLALKKTVVRGNRTQPPRLMFTRIFYKKCAVNRQLTVCLDHTK
jgi:hypothetical protein